ncbi:sushi, nidogen and EGF-like domain-containing protein 1 [Ptychodera flava]|uniref:sushi, nidogen and EGF-like domain-containing protein 1 n=1 Tax=Ptychodera flava TaxID=63121 RepID=UPI00396A9A9F
MPIKTWHKSVSTHYTHDPIFAKASSDELKVRLQGDCALIMDYARSINDSTSTYDPCYNDLLFPYGPEFGDNVNEKNDDGGSGEYFVSIPFPFFDENHDSLWVNTNGVISFLTEVMTFTPDPFPLDDNRRLVAPFWADVDTRDGGDVYYREVHDPNDHLLKQTKELIVQQFADHQKFEVTWLFIATWDDVAFFDSSAIGNLKRNTFQCVLATNGRHSFALYHYGNVTWTTGAASQGDPDTGLGGKPAQVGFNAGDGINFDVVNGSRTGDIVNIDTWSNVGVAGRFLFRIDNKIIEHGGCNTEGVLSVYPSFGYMLGGQRIYVSGPCFDNTVEISCKFGDNVVKATMDSAVVATCKTPILYEVGRIEFRLSTDGGVSFDKYRGLFTVVSEEYRTSIVKRVDSANWHTLNDLTIEWDTSEFLTSRLHVSLYCYVEDVHAGLKFITSLSPDPIDNSGRYTFTRQPENGVLFRAGVIRLSDHEVNFDE